MTQGGLYRLSGGKIRARSGVVFHVILYLLRDEGITPLGFETVDICIAVGPRYSSDLRLWICDYWAPAW